jgi:hypothetical protein
LNTLDEGSKKELVKLLSEDDNTLEQEYNIIKEQVIGKLTNHQKVSDNETSSKIDETITKIKNEKYDKLTFFKLKDLNENL